MANDEHVAILKKGVGGWNKWREANPGIRAILSKADLRKADLRNADLSKADLSGAVLSQANLSGANLEGADLSEASFRQANLEGAKLTGAHFGRETHFGRAIFSEANLSGANLSAAIFDGVHLIGANLTGANLRGANLGSANLRGANLTGLDLSGLDLSEALLSFAHLGKANLSGANLSGADLRATDFIAANLRGANLRGAQLIQTDFTDADLAGCRVYGISAWNLKLEGAKQQNLVITGMHEPEITVDDIEVAQFIYLLLNNPKIRDVIDTIGRKAVLILGRFTPARKTVLDALREELRKRDYVPILFDFDKSASQDLTATVSTLAHLARFIIADLTDPSSIPYELATVVPTTPVAVQPILLAGCKEFVMFQDLRRRHHWVLPTQRYDSPGQLITDLDTLVIRPSESKVLELRGT
jgi:uncharacterized protein YjbI with pentapeptide repeats